MLRERKGLFSMEKAQYAIGDTVMYATQGVCRIVDIEKKEFAGVTAEYYVLKPVYTPNSTVYVPLANGTLTGRMRRLLSKEEVGALIQAMPQEPSVWIADENARKESHREVLAKGDHRQLIQAIKSVYLHRKELQEQGRKLHMTDERFFKEAEKMLYDEFALVLGIQPDQVLPFILSRIDQEGSGQEALRA